MSIQASYLHSADAYASSLLAVSAATNGKSGNSLPGNNAASSATPDMSTAVSISQEAQNLLAVENAANMASSISANSTVTINMNNSMAAKAAYSLAYSTDLPLENISHMSLQTGLGATYVATGAPVTPQSEAAFNQQASQIDAGRLSIYQSDTAAGKTPQQTLADMINYMNDQSPAYQALDNWSQQAASLES